MPLRLANSIGLIVVLCLIYAALAVSNAGGANETKQGAEQIWEQTIAAKGGRGRLYAVRNMLISSRAEYATHLFKKNQNRREELFVFPNKYWFWDDYRPDVFGLTMEMYNYDSRMSYAITQDDLHPPEPITDTHRNKALRNVQLAYLLETKWLKPALVKASTGRIGLRAVDIVQTTVEGERVDFAFDRETHLPVRVSYYNIVDSKTYIDVQSFSDYTEIDGIKVPLTHKYDDGTEDKSTIRFNVEYNEDIFIKPPPIEAGPEAWKIAKR